MILENDLKFHVFLEAVESEVAAAVASRFKDPAQHDCFINDKTYFQNFYTATIKIWGYFALSLVDSTCINISDSFIHDYDLE